jgi:DNA-directed RNA polymerase specialized sigma24 family protein
LARFAAAGLDTHDEADLSSFLTRCQRAGVDRTQLLGIIIAMAPTDEVAALGALVVMAPQLRRMARLLSGRPFDPNEAEAEMVAIAWEVPTRPRPDGDGPLPAAVLDAIWSEARRSAGLRRGQLEVVPLDDGYNMAASEPDPFERWPGLLAAAVAERVLTPRQVVLIAQTRMEGQRLSDVAAALHRPLRTAYKERERAEAALRAFALEYYLEGAR